MRPRVKINRETGTCQTVQTKGGQNWSGQKFEMESVAAGSEFTFKLYLYEREHEYEATIERILGALQAGNIQLGGQKSNGCGYVEFKELLKIDYDMTREKDRKLWRDESKEGQSILEELKGRVSTLDHRIHFELKGKVDSEILVKSIDVRDYNEESADAEQMRRADGELLIPATSIKGVLRSQMEKIAKLRQLPVSDIEAVFGKNAEKEESIKEKIAKIKKIKAKKGIRNAGIVIIAIIIIFILVLILDKSQNTFNGQVLKIVGITEQKTEEAKEKQESKEEKKQKEKAVKVAQEKFKELGEKVKKEELEVLKIKRKGEYYYKSKQRTSRIIYTLANGRHQQQEHLQISQ